MLNPGNAQGKNVSTTRLLGSRVDPVASIGGTVMKEVTSMIMVRTFEYKNGVLVRVQTVRYKDVSPDHTEAVIDFLEKTEKNNYTA